MKSKTLRLGYVQRHILQSIDSAEFDLRERDILLRFGLSRSKADPRYRSFLNESDGRTCQAVVARTIRSLMDRGFISRTRHKNVNEDSPSYLDHRSYRYYITQAGKLALKGIRSASHQPTNEVIKKPIEQSMNTKPSVKYHFTKQGQIQCITRPGIQIPEQLTLRNLMIGQVGVRNVGSTSSRPDYQYLLCVSGCNEMGQSHYMFVDLCDSVPLATDGENPLDYKIDEILPTGSVIEFKVK